MAERRRGIGRVAAALAALVVAYFLLWPVPVDPVVWDPPPHPPLTGALAINDGLTKADRLGPTLHGPEDVAVAPDGRIFSGTFDGTIVVYPPDGSVAEPWVSTGGRPLGLAWDAAQNLIVADARLGLLSIAPDKTRTTLTTTSEGVAFGLADDVDVADDGRIYFSDASDKFALEHYKDDILEGRPHGRLLRYDPATHETQTLLDQLYFANGVAVGPDDAFVLVCETSRFRVRRLWLKGPRAGQSEIFVDDLPGYTDGVSATDRGTFWVAVFAPRNGSADRLAPRPWLAKVVRRLPEALLPKAAPYGLVVEVDAAGAPIRSLHDASGAWFPGVTSAEEWRGTLYVGSLRHSTIARVAL